MEEEIGKIKKSDKVDIVIKVDDYGGKEGITIREFIETEKYSGFTNKGIRIPGNKWNDFKKLVEKVKI